MKTGTQIINGVEYVYEDRPYWDPVKKRGSHKRNYIGKNVDGVFVPNKKYLLRQELESIKNKTNPASILTEICTRTFYGATYLLNEIGRKTGLEQDLKACFPNDYKAILSLAYYLVLESQNPMHRFSRWFRTHEHPSEKDIPSKRISELFGRISETDKMVFFQRQSKRRLEKEYLAYGTTSISSYSHSLKQVRYGKNKEQDLLPQLNLALLFGEKSGLPVYYRKLAGNISDVKTVENLIKDMEFLEIKKLNLVMDRGFYSERNINMLYRHHHKFLIAGKTSLKFIRQKLDEIRENFDSRKNYNSKTNLYIQSFLMDWDYTQTKPRSGEVIKERRRIYVHYYFNAQRAADDKVCLNVLLDQLEYELLEGRRNPENKKLYHKYYTITSTPMRGTKIEPKQNAIRRTEKDCGFFVLLSNSIKEPVETLELYRAKDLVEKAFGNLKERLNMRRESVASEENLEGKLFIQFVALIYLSYIKKAMDDAGLFKNYTMQELLDDLDIIERFQQPGKSHHLGEMTEKQKKLYGAMGIEVPS